MLLFNAIDVIADAFEDTHWYSTFTTELQASLNAMVQPDADFLADLDMYTFAEDMRDTNVMVEVYDEYTGKTHTGLLTKWAISPYYAEELAGIERAYVVCEGAPNVYALLEHINPICEVDTHDDNQDAPLPSVSSAVQSEFGARLAESANTEHRIYVMPPMPRGANTLVTAVSA